MLHEASRLGALNLREREPRPGSASPPRGGAAGSPPPLPLHDHFGPAAGPQDAASPPGGASAAAASAAAAAAAARAASSPSKLLADELFLAWLAQPDTQRLARAAAPRGAGEGGGGC